MKLDKIVKPLKLVCNVEYDPRSNQIVCKHGTWKVYYDSIDNTYTLVMPCNSKIYLYYDPRSGEYLFEPL